MPVSSTNGGVVYNPSTGRRTISSATRLERTAVVRTNSAGTFRTSSANGDVKSAVDLLNRLRVGTQAYGNVSSLVVPKLLDCTLSSVAVSVDHDEVIPSPSSEGEAATGGVVHRRREAPRRPNLNGLRLPQVSSTAPSWHAERNPGAAAASLAVDAEIASRRVTPLEMHRAERISVEPQLEPANGTEEVREVPPIRQLREELKKDAEWMRYWGNLERMHLFHKSLISRLTDAEATAAREHSDVAWMQSKLEALLKESSVMDDVMKQHKRLAEEAVARERGRQDSLMEHNELLNAKIVEMRRQVALTERSANALRGELDVSTDTANKLKMELENIQDKHRIELLQLRRELAPDEAGDRLRRHRLETLEAECTRKDDMIGTLQTTLDVLEEEKRRLSEKVESLSAAANVSQTKGPSGGGGSSIDAVTIQNMTARQYQRREGELVASNTELRKANAALEVGLDTLRDRLLRYSVAVESGLMRHHDLSQDASSTENVARTPNVQGKSKASTTANVRGGAPYKCVPITFPPDVVSAEVRRVLQAAPPPGVPAALVELRSRMMDDVPTLFSVFRDTATRLWALTEKTVPEHPKRDAGGDREATHAWLTTAVASMATATNRMLVLCNETVDKCAVEYGAGHAARSAAAMEVESLNEQHALAITDMNARINVLFDENEALKRTLASQRGDVAIAQAPSDVQPPPLPRAPSAANLEQLSNVTQSLGEALGIRTAAPEAATLDADSVLEAVVGSLKELLAGVIRQSSERPTDVPTAPPTPKRIDAGELESMRRAHEDALAAQKHTFESLIAKSDEQNRELQLTVQRLDEALKSSQSALHALDERTRELQGNAQDMAVELARARQEVAAVAAVPSVVTSPSPKEPLPCSTCVQLRNELDRTQHANAKLSADIGGLVQMVAHLQEERGELTNKLALQDRALSILDEERRSATALDDPRHHAEVRTTRERASQRRPASAASALPRTQGPVLSCVDARGISPVAAMRQRIRHDRAHLVSPGRTTAASGTASVVHLELNPEHSFQGNTVYYTHSPVEPHRQEDVLHYMKQLKDAQWQAHSPPSSLPVDATVDSSHARYSPVPFFTTFGLPVDRQRSPSPRR